MVGHLFSGYSYATFSKQYEMIMENQKVIKDSFKNTMGPVQTWCWNVFDCCWIVLNAGLYTSVLIQIVCTEANCRSLDPFV